MAQVDVEVAGRRYDVACRDGEEEHLRSLAAIVDKRSHDAASALGTLTETRQLLYAALLIADDLKDTRAGAGLPDPTPPRADPELAEALERLAERVENLAARLEQDAVSA